MKVVVGLGNPGSRYAGTRHNVGFAVLDLLAQGPRAGRWQSRFQAQVCELTEDATKVLLVKPDTFMNLSGRCVRQVVDFYQLPLEDLLVVCDDVNLPLGKLRFRPRGTHGGHNGLRDIQSHLGTTHYSRLRIGVGAPDVSAARNGAASSATMAMARFDRCRCLRTARSTSAFVILGRRACSSPIRSLP